MGDLDPVRELPYRPAAVFLSDHAQQRSQRFPLPGRGRPRMQTNQHYGASYTLERGTALAAPRPPGETCCRLFSGAGSKTWRQAICRQPLWPLGYQRQFVAQVTPQQVAVD